MKTLNKPDFYKIFCDEINKELRKECRCVLYAASFNYAQIFNLRLYIKGTACLANSEKIGDITLHDKAIELTLNDTSLELLERSFIFEYYQDFTKQIATIINKHVEKKIQELTPLNAQIYCRKK